MTSRNPDGKGFTLGGVGGGAAGAEADKNKKKKIIKSILRGNKEIFV